MKRDKGDLGSKKKKKIKTPISSQIGIIETPSHHV